MSREESCDYNDIDNDGDGDSDDGNDDSTLSRHIINYTYHTFVKFITAHHTYIHTCIHTYTYNHSVTDRSSI